MDEMKVGKVFIAVAYWIIGFGLGVFSYFWVIGSDRGTFPYYVGKWGFVGSCIIFVAGYNALRK